MLDANDLKLIGEEMGRVIDDNLLPRIDELIDEKLEPLKEEISDLKISVAGIQATMVTKEYLDGKLGDLKGDLTSQDRRLEQKTDVLIDTLADRRVLKSGDRERLEKTRVFPL